jgi:hypothetical protein
MTEIVVSKRDGTAVAPDGTRYRVKRGRTLAHANHPVVEAHPHDWLPMHIELATEDAPSAPEGLDELRAQLEDAQGETQAAEDEAAAHREQLTRLADGLHARQLVPAGIDTERPGWLVDLVLEALDERRGEPAVAGAVADDVPVPRPPRKRAGKLSPGDGD